MQTFIPGRQLVARLGADVQSELQWTHSQLEQKQVDYRVLVSQLHCQWLITVIGIAPA